MILICFRFNHRPIFNVPTIVWTCYSRHLHHCDTHVTFGEFILFITIIRQVISNLSQASMNITAWRGKTDKDSERCESMKLWEIPDTKCRNFNWIGFLAMELAQGRLVYLLNVSFYSLYSFAGCPEAPGVCIGVYFLVIIFLMSGLVKLSHDIIKWNVCS